MIATAATLAYLTHKYYKNPQVDKIKSKNNLESNLKNENRNFQT